MSLTQLAVGAMIEKQMLGGGSNAVWRKGPLVIRDAKPSTPSIHAVLRHLERVGFHAAPTVDGTGFDADGRATLRFIEGTTINQAPWPNEAAFVALGSIIGAFHAAMKSFTPPPEARWERWFVRDLGESSIIGHCDLAPWNIVARNGSPVALVDWEYAGPVDPLTDFAYAAWTNAQLYDDDVAAMHGLPDAATRARQVRILSDAYGLAEAQRQLLVQRMLDVAILSAAHEVVEAKIIPQTETVAGWGIAWRTRSAAWIVRNRAVLEAALR